MPEYTYKDVIIDPTSEEAMNCVGKEVYYADNPTTCLSNADNNYDNFCEILREIDTATGCPFVLGSRGTRWACIIPKKEEPKPEYVPFESANEFVEAYRAAYLSGARGDVEDSLCSVGGLWLTRKCDSLLIAKCIEISDKGVALGLNHQATPWDELLDSYEFPDGMPCGKLKEEHNG